jgi:hypothetical protein
MVARKLLFYVTLLHFYDFNGDIANKDLVIGRFEETVVEGHCDLLLFGFVS